MDSYLKIRGINGSIRDPKLLHYFKLVSLGSYNRGLPFRSRSEMWNHLRILADDPVILPGIRLAFMKGSHHRAELVVGTVKAIIPDVFIDNYAGPIDKSLVEFDMTCTKSWNYGPILQHWETLPRKNSHLMHRQKHASEKR